MKFIFWLGSSILIIGAIFFGVAVKYSGFLPNSVRIFGVFLPCKLIGQELNPGGFRGSFCYTPNKDAGKQCNSSKDCQGSCLIGNPNDHIGKCTKEQTLFGCSTYLDENGKAMGRCAD